MSEAEQQAAIQTARELAPEFDKVGKEADEKNEFPFSTVPLYKAANLPGLAVPKEYGGAGADILTTARVSYELAKGDPATALAYNMHQVMVGILRGLMPQEQKEKWLSRVASENLLMCGTFSEERHGFTGLADTTATPVDGGFRIEGKKNWATLSEAADITTFNATILNEDGSWPENHLERMARERVFITDKNQDGIRIDRTWDTQGMRATGTQTLVFDGCVIPAEAEVGDMRMGLVSEFEWAALLFGGVYLGLAVKAFEATRDALIKKSTGATAMAEDQQVRDVGWVQWGLGEMKADIETADRVLEQTARMLIEARDAAEWNPLARPAMIDVVKVVTTRAARNATNNGLRLVGGATYRRGHVLERLSRDARSGTFQPLTTDACYEHLGKFELGLIEAPGAAGDSGDGAARERQTAGTAA